MHKLFYRELYSILHPVTLLNSPGIVRLEKFRTKIVIVLVLIYQIEGTDCSRVSQSFLSDSKARTWGQCCKLHSCLQSCCVERRLLLEVMLLTLVISNIYAIFLIRSSISDTSHILLGRTLHATHYKSLWVVINFYYILFSANSYSFQPETICFTFWWMVHAQPVCLPFPLNKTVFFGCKFTHYEELSSFRIHFFIT